ncbi:uncharacterized protein DMAD_12752 [Drosophila madeirensis]|uniref:Uncharacterized protein n=1 Tax=Drosophila madeirensis TaxID=30013 RepID=A0AAU9FIB5_DROMD
MNAASGSGQLEGQKEKKKGASYVAREDCFNMSQFADELSRIRKAVKNDHTGTALHRIPCPRLRIKMPLKRAIQSTKLMT